MFYVTYKENSGETWTEFFTQFNELDAARFLNQVDLHTYLTLIEHNVNRNLPGQVSLRKWASQTYASPYLGSGDDYFPGYGLEGIRQMAGMRSNSLNHLRRAFAGH